MVQAELVAGDWGTSSLRLWALSAGGAVLAERHSAEGMSTLSPGGFEPVLRGHLTAMGVLRPGLPVVLCGMVGARQGWSEAGYAAIPAGPGVICDQATRVAADGLDIRILPGLADHRPGQEDVMRGEETQLLGLLLEDPEFSGQVCLPGTHSKWVRIAAGQVQGFSTVMTGELFALLGRHSVLQHSLLQAAPSGDPDAPAFRAGLTRGLAAPERLMAALFGVRAASLLRGTTGADAADTLSGLLIGAEIAGAGPPDGPVTLLAGGSLAALYAGALAAAGHRVRTLEAGLAVRRGLVFAARRLWPEILA